MNYLQLCQRAKRECAIPGALTTTVAQSGALQRLTDWVADAYGDICALEDNWNFLRSSFSLNTIIGKQTYEITDCVDTRIAEPEVGFAGWWEDTFFIYRQSAGLATQALFPHYDYPGFRYRWLRGTHPNQPPMCFTVRPDDDALLLGPKPDAVYVITGEYQFVAPELSDDDEEPLFGPRFHMAVVWLATQRYAAYEEDGGLYASSGIEYSKVLSALKRNHLPTPTLGGALV